LLTSPANLFSGSIFLVFKDNKLFRVKSIVLFAIYEDDWTIPDLLVAIFGCIFKLSSALLSLA